MEEKTFEAYKNLIKARYEAAKNEDVSSVLSNPSPASLRRMCIDFYTTDATTDDKVMLNKFFDIKNHDTAVAEMERYDRDKFIPIRRFLLGDTVNPQQPVVEVAAILVNFQLRPYNRFRKTDTASESINSPTIPEDTAEKDANTDEPTKTLPTVNVSLEHANANTIGWRSRINPSKSAVLVAASILLFLFGGYMIKSRFFEKPECMQWKGDHYEPVECNGNAIGFANIDPTYAYDANVSQLKKIAVTDTTVFFKDGNPIVWYRKQYNKVTFYNQPGVDPVSGKPLLPVTQYIVRKYAGQ